MNQDQIERSILLDTLAAITGKHKHTVKAYFYRKLWNIRKSEHFWRYLEKFGPIESAYKRLNKNHDTE